MTTLRGFESLEEGSQMIADLLEAYFKTLATKTTNYVLKSVKV